METFFSKLFKSSSAVLPIKKAESVGKGIWSVLAGWSFNGEKNFGELGPAKSYFLDYITLRIRSWQLYLESDTAQTILRKFIIWEIGAGLKLQARPIKRILESSKIKIDSEEFSKTVEARFGAWASSPMSDYAHMMSLNKKQSEAKKNSLVGGDYLVILRIKKGNLTVQLVDGAHIVSPMYGDENFPNVLKNGNTIVEGIELSPSGEHVAYYVRKPGESAYTYQTERILARGSKTGLKMAYMVYGNRYRLDNHRGMPLLSVVFETMKKLERYKEATVGSAEERQKIAYSIEHDIFSTGENPLLNQTAFARQGGLGDNADLPTDSYGEALANRVAATTDKMAFNMPLGAHLKALESKNELYFRDFIEVNIMMVCASVGIPYEVAMSKYDSNFSASRAALKDWENTLLVTRDDDKEQFLQPIYELWLWNEIMNGRISAPGFIKAWLSEDHYVLSAYYNCGFVGSSVPHIDPLKEVQAERLKLGQLSAAMPLTTLEGATAALNGGESDANLEQFADEFKESVTLGLKMIEKEKTQAQKDKKKDAGSGTI